MREGMAFGVGMALARTVVDSVLGGFGGDSGGGDVGGGDAAPPPPLPPQEGGEGGRDEGYGQSSFNDEEED